MDTKNLIIIGAIFAGLLVLKWVLGNLSGGGGKVAMPPPLPADKG